MSMQQIWGYTLLSLIIVSLLSFVGAFTLAVRPEKLRGWLLYLVSFAAGALLGDVFLHILPEINKLHFGVREGIYILSGILLFFVFEKYIHWHHSHTEHEEGIHAVVYLTIAGDALHNFMDGLIIAGSFLAGPAIGLATSIAVILHEIPHELGNFAVLVHGGWKAQKALFYNFVSSFAAILGGVIVLSLARNFQSSPTLLLALGASSFIYVSLSDLIPEIHKETGRSKSVFLLIAFVLGVAAMGLLLLLE